MDIVAYFEQALQLKLRPLLLEFTHPKKRTPLLICGINPITSLTVRHGHLYIDDKIAGDALDIFRYLELKKNGGFFPAYLGYFSYEFARYFGKSCSDKSGDFPDAQFFLYEEGLVIDDGTIIHHTPLPSPGINAFSAQSMGKKSLTPLLKAEEFYAIMKKIKDKIKDGDVYQVNFSLPFSFAADKEDMLYLYDAMKKTNPSPFMGIVSSDDGFLLSGSPERLFSLYDQNISTRPIAGTKKRGRTPTEDDEQLSELTQCLKEQAEHAMLVDLMKNDLNRIAIPGSVTVTEDRSVEFYSHVMHMVSEVTGKTSSTLLDIFQAIFPGGTITGAPKESVMKTIAELESCPRGPYTGSLGYISAGYGCDFNILIRSVFMRNRAVIHTGAGIVIDSDERDEWLEIERKAMAINDILEKRSIPKPKRATIVGPKIARVDIDRQNGRKILFMENRDSFSFNIIDALIKSGATVEITKKPLPTLLGFSHVVIGPGPGNPAHLPLLEEFIRHALEARLPILGICLGHQAIGHYFGAKIKQAREPIHGKSHDVVHQKLGLFRGLRTPAKFVRYHSLVIASAPTDFIVDAYCKDDSIMAIRHKELPIFGVQFHPESYLSHDGHIILANFLKSSYS